MSISSKPYIKIYTDGSCSGNPGVGGWGALLICKDSRKTISGYKNNTTNNQMEMQAAISALEILQKPCKIELYTDSKYLQKGIMEWIYNWEKNNWRTTKKQLVKNVELWKKLKLQIEKHDINWLWVKGHSNNEGNEIADNLATCAMQKAKMSST